jgi:hypothetical protein
VLTQAISRNPIRERPLGGIMQKRTFFARSGVA